MNSKNNGGYEKKYVGTDTNVGNDTNIVKLTKKNKHLHITFGIFLPNIFSNIL